MLAQPTTDVAPGSTAPKAPAISPPVQPGAPPAPSPAPASGGYVPAASQPSANPIPAAPSISPPAPQPEKPPPAPTPSGAGSQSGAATQQPAASPPPDPTISGVAPPGYQEPVYKNANGSPVTPSTPPAITPPLQAGAVNPNAPATPPGMGTAGTVGGPTGPASGPAGSYTPPPPGSTPPAISPPSVGGPAGPNAGIPLTNTGDAISSWMANPDPFKQQDVQNTYNFLAGRLGEQAGIASAGADTGAASRGLFYSTVPQQQKYGPGGIYQNLNLGLGQLASNLLVPEAQATQAGLAGSTGAATNFGAQAMAGQNLNFEEALQAAMAAQQGMPTMTGMFGGALAPFQGLTNQQGNYNPNMFTQLGNSFGSTNV